MNILVTGGAGFIGSHVVDALMHRGDRVVVLDNLATRVHPEGMWPSYLHQDARRIRGDVSEREDWVAALDDIDAVVHLAAYQDYQLDFSRFARVNDMGTALLYEVLVETGQPLTRVVVATPPPFIRSCTSASASHLHLGLACIFTSTSASWVFFATLLDKKSSFSTGFIRDSSIFGVHLASFCSGNHCFQHGL